MNYSAPVYGIQSTAGAIPVRNEKGELSMQKVKVQRYISGKRPEYARDESSQDDSDFEDFIDNRKRVALQESQLNAIASRVNEDEIDDPRLRRLKALDINTEERIERRRHIHEPEMVESDSEESERELTPVVEDSVINTNKKITLASDSESDTDLSDTEIENRRLKLRQRMLQQQRDVEVLQKEEENQSASSESESSEYEEETDGEEENEPRLKPLFVRKRDRATIIEKEQEAVKQKLLDIESKKTAKDRRRQTLRLVEETVKKDLEKAKPENSEPNINDVCTDDDNDELEYEAWKLRELKRIKRDREERENVVKEKVEIERLRGMTEEERRQELRHNPKLITNKAAKGKYKFLQKYYHRGAFYLDQESDVYKRDFSQATLEDHFDKTILPKVMQVKNFGRCGRTKYTHLVDQDTTQFDSPWYADTSNNIKFHNEKSGGMKQVFEKPTLEKKRKMM